MDAATRADLARVERRMQELIDQRTRNIPSTWPRPNAAPEYVRIIGGNSYNGVDCIVYAAVAPTITSLLDPYTTTSFDSGLGYGEMLNDAGQGTGEQVLCWHDFGGFTSPMDGGYTARVRDRTVLTVASGADAGRPLVFCRFTFPG